MRTINVGGRTYDLHFTIGKVQETGKNMETRVSGGGGGGFTYGGYGGTSNVTIRSQTTIHDQLFLEDKDGNEHAFQLQDFNIAARQGQEVAVIWAIKKGKPTGKYIAVVNYSTNNNFYNEKALKNVFRFNIWYFFGGGLLVGLLYGHDMSSAIFGVMLSVLAWVLVWDLSKLNHFKETIAKDILADK